MKSESVSIRSVTRICPPTFLFISKPIYAPALSMDTRTVNRSEILLREILMPRGLTKEGVWKRATGTPTKLPRLTINMTDDELVALGILAHEADTTPTRYVRELIKNQWHKGS